MVEYLRQVALPETCASFCFLDTKPDIRISTSASYSISITASSNALSLSELIVLA